MSDKIVSINQFKQAKETNQTNKVATEIQPFLDILSKVDRIPDDILLHEQFFPTYNDVVCSDDQHSLLFLLGMYKGKLLLLAEDISKAIKSDVLLDSDFPELLSYAYADFNEGRNEIRLTIPFENNIVNIFFIKFTNTYMVSEVFINFKSLKQRVLEEFVTMRKEGNAAINIFLADEMKTKLKDMLFKLETTHNNPCCIPLIAYSLASNNIEQDLLDRLSKHYTLDEVEYEVEDFILDTAHRKIREFDCPHTVENEYRVVSDVVFRYCLELIQFK